MTESSEAGPAVPRYGLRWAIKSSFVGYVSRMSDGRVYISSGAAVTERTEFVFPFEEVTGGADGGERTFSFTGKVTFTGHFGMLWVQIAEPRITLRDGEAELTVTDPESKDGARVPLATLHLTGPTLDGEVAQWESADPRLTPEGVELFGDVYQPGEPFELLAITTPAQDSDGSESRG